MLCMADELGCARSRDVLLQLAACGIHRLSSVELCELSADTFVSLITAVCQNYQQQDRHSATASSQASDCTVDENDSWAYPVVTR